MGKTPNRVAGYVRLSREDAASNSVERQTEQISAACLGRGWPAPTFFIDPNHSGYAKTTRPAYEHLLSRLDEFDAVVVWKLDRFSRNVRRFVNDIDKLNEANVAFVSIMDGIDLTTATGEAFATILATLAQLESANTASRVKDRQRSDLRAGRWSGGPRPFGWKPVRHADGMRLRLFEPEARHLRKLIALTQAGRSLADLGDYCRENGVTGPQGGRSPLDTATIRTILRSPRLYGAQTTTRKQNLQLERHLVVTDGEHNTVQGPEALISYPEWQRLQATLDRRSASTQRRQQRPSFLGGILLCAGCHSRMYGHHRTVRGRDHSRYVCKGTSSRDPACPGNSIVARRVDEIVAETLLAWLTPEAVERAQQQYATADDHQATALKESLSRAQQRRDFLMASLLEADPATENWRQLDELRRATASELDDLAERLSQLSAPSPLATLDAADLAERWDDLDLERQREALRIAVRAVWVRPAGQRGEDPGERITTIDWRLDLSGSVVSSSPPSVA